MTKSNRAFGAPLPGGADHTNKAGAPSWSRSIEEQTLAVLTCNTLSNTFYAKKQDLAKDAVSVLTEMAKKDAEFLGKALVYARNHGFMKLLPVVGLAVLSKHEQGTKTVFRKVFPQVVRIPDDLREFVALCRAGSIAKLGGERRDATARWMKTLSPYHAVKYGSSRSEGVTLRDILRLVHPKPEGKAQEALFRWLVKGFQDKDELNPFLPKEVTAFETIKRLEDDKAIAGIVADANLPHEVVIPSVKKMTLPIWEALLFGMPYFALVRNLNTLKRHGVLDNSGAVEVIAKRIENPAFVKKSKMLPFRFYAAWTQFDGPKPIKEALEKALELSFENIEPIPGKVCIANDVSGSMGTSISDKSSIRFCDVAGILGAALYKKSSDDVLLLPFDDHVHPHDVKRTDAMMDIVKKISGAGGGTDVGAPIQHLLKTRTKVDVFVGITDSEDWGASGYVNFGYIRSNIPMGGFLATWREYKATVAPDAKAFLITISPHRDFLAPETEKDVFSILGWNDSVVRFVSSKARSGQGQVDAVRGMSLDRPKAESEADESDE